MRERVKATKKKVHSLCSTEYSFSFLEKKKKQHSAKATQSRTPSLLLPYSLLLHCSLSPRRKRCRRLSRTLHFDRLSSVSFLRASASIDKSKKGRQEEALLIQIEQLLAPLKGIYLSSFVSFCFCFFSVFAFLASPPILLIYVHCFLSFLRSFFPFVRTFLRSFSFSSFFLLSFLPCRWPPFYVVFLAFLFLLGFGFLCVSFFLQT